MSRPPLRITVAEAVPPAGIVRVPELRETHFVPGWTCVALRAHVRPLPVSSWNATSIAPSTGFPPVDTPKLTEAGERVAGVRSADRTLIRPPPRDNGLAKAAPLEGLFTGRSAVFTKADFTCSGDQPGCAANRRAAAPVARGVAIEDAEENEHDVADRPSGGPATTSAGT